MLNRFRNGLRERIMPYFKRLRITCRQNGLIRVKVRNFNEYLGLGNGRNNEATLSFVSD